MLCEEKERGREGGAVSETSAGSCRRHEAA